MSRMYGQLPSYYDNVSSLAQLMKNQVADDFGKALNDCAGTDCVITVPKVDELGVYSRHVHKAVLVARSTVFATMLAPRTKMKETQTNKINIKNLSPKGLDVLLKFLYTGEVSKDWGLVALEMVDMADKYGLTLLKKYGDLNLKSVCTTTNAVELYVVAKLHGLPTAKGDIAKIIAGNVMGALDEYF